MSDDDNAEGSTRSDSPMPSWMAEHNTPYKTQDNHSEEYVMLSSDSDDNQDLKLTVAATEEPMLATSSAAVEPQPQARNTCKPERPPAVVLASRSELPVLLPDKLPRTKVLVELEPSGHQATDLSGDAGAVGRFIVSGKAGSELVRMDLKGSVYCCRILPLAGSIMVINMGADSAKVETLVNDYVRLEEESNFYESEAMLEGTAMDLMGDDDDNYRPTALEVGATTAGPSGTAAAGKSKAPGAAKPRAAGGAKVSKGPDGMKARAKPMKKAAGAGGGKGRGKGPAKSKSAKPRQKKPAGAGKKAADKDS